mmetsp:Transcript_23/g.64  ORF Transcript_23/g.64 Transcript_23/m.64 type:complete len:291 (+) Transcript_23:830-1702(+)
MSKFGCRTLRINDTSRSKSSVMIGSKSSIRECSTLIATGMCPHEPRKTLPKAPTPMTVSKCRSSSGIVQAKDIRSFSSRSSPSNCSVNSRSLWVCPRTCRVDLSTVRYRMKSSDSTSAAVSAAKKKTMVATAPAVSSSSFVQIVLANRVHGVVVYPAGHLEQMEHSRLELVVAGSNSYAARNPPPGMRKSVAQSTKRTKAPCSGLKYCPSLNAVAGSTHADDGAIEQLVVFEIQFPGHPDRVGVHRRYPHSSFSTPPPSHVQLVAVASPLASDRSKLSHRSDAPSFMKKP